MATLWVAQADKNVFLAHANHRAFLPIQLQSHWGLAVMPGVLWSSLNPLTRVDMTDTDGPETWCLFLGPVIQKLMAESQQLGTVE